MPSTEILVGLFQAGIGTVFLVLYIRGDILSKSTVETILKEAEHRSLKIAKEINESITDAVEQGFKNAYYQIKKENGKQ